MRISIVVPEIRQDKIRAIIEQYFAYGGSDLDMPYNQRFDAAAEVIAALPVDRVEAMAALVSKLNDCTYKVPDGIVHCLINWSDAASYCDCGSSGNCDHIHAVRLYLERRAKKEQG